MKRTPKKRSGTRTVGTRPKRSPEDEGQKPRNNGRNGEKKKEKRVPKHSRKEPQRRTDNVKEQEEQERPSQGQGRNTKESEAGNAAIYSARGRSKETAEPLA